SIRGTSINAARAASAAVRSWHISLQFQRSENDTQEQPRSDLLIQDACVLPDPANSRVFGIHTFHQRPGVHVAASLEIGRDWISAGRMIRCSRQGSLDATQLLHPRLWIIFLAPGVS